jgi:hypothetical protein
VRERDLAYYHAPYGGWYKRRRRDLAEQRVAVEDRLAEARRESKNARQRVYHDANRERENERSRAWREANRERVRAYSLAYYLRPGTLNAHNRARRARDQRRDDVLLTELRTWPR